MHNENAIFVKVGRIASEEVTLQLFIERYRYYYYLD